uniref:hypothetical protein n=1 Tax=Agathobacter sp. TaxID=2021311 RepID=UPI004057540C
MNKVLRSFSTGQKNQFEVILALCQGAEYILMDEPFAGIAAICKNNIWGIEIKNFVCPK